MTTISLVSLLQQVRARKAVLGMRDTAVEVEALRNSGVARTPAKRELLRRVERRARAAGLEPIISHR